MSIDYALWKWSKAPPEITAGLCYLLLTESLECAEVAPLDVERLNDEIEVAFPDPDALALVVEVSPSVVFLDTHGSTPISVVEWFANFAAREGLIFFDPQNAPITEADERECQRRTEQLQLREANLRAAASLGELRVQAAAGDPRALLRLGNCYSFGEGVVHDHSIAFALFEQAAKAGYSDGMFNLAACYRLGQGVKRDIDAAITWYLKAAETDPRFAYFALGEIYANGENGEANKEKAIYYLQLSWDRGNPAAYRFLRSLGVRPQ